MNGFLAKVDTYLSSFDNKPEEHAEILRLLEIISNDSENEIFEHLKLSLAIAMDELNLYGTSLLSIIYSQFPQFCNSDAFDKPCQIADGYRYINTQFAKTPLNQASMVDFVLLSVSDIRSVLLAIIFNLVKIRTLQKLSDDEIKKELDLAVYVYAPICHRLGFYKIKSEIDDRILAYQKPEIYKQINDRIQAKRIEWESQIETFLQPVRAELDAHKISYKIKWRTKSIAGIFSKMVKQDVPLENVYDLFAVRIITQSQPNKEISDCWHVFSVVTNFYKPEIKRLRDWISRPRENGYESLHITVEAFENQIVEVQIRSERMDDEAENGMAAHWRYKGGKSDSAVNDFMLRIRKAIERKDSMEVADLNERNLRDLYVFTPTGELKKLRQGATVLDFAFAIHSEVGIRCSGAKVNGKVRPIKHKLTNGDRVEIFTAKTQKPAMDWLNFVTSNKAKAHIRKVLDEKRKQEMEDGKELLMRRLRNWKMDFSQEIIDLLVHHFKVKQAGDIYVDIYRGKIDPAIIKKLINPTSQDGKSTERESSGEKLIRTNKSDALIVDDIDRVNYKLSGCCNPVPGDKIFGFVTVSKGISIHRMDCSNAASMHERFPYRILPAQWKSTSEDNLDFRAQIFLRGNDRAGVLAEITKVVTSHANLLKVNLTSKGIVFQGKIEVGIKEKEQLQTLLTKLQALRDITEVYRVKS